jgi:hypothetical protein
VKARLLLPLALVVFVPGCVSRTQSRAPIEPASYARVMETPSGVLQLEIPARRFSPRNGRGPDIWLTGVIHIGDAAYYQALQKHLDAQALVLFEGVGGESLKRGPGSKNQDTNEGETESGFALQSQMAHALGLEFQLETIEYNRPNFRNSDLSVEEIAALMARSDSDVQTGAAWNFEQLMKMMEGQSAWSGLVQLGFSLIGGQKRFQSLTKVMFIQTLGDLGGDIQTLGGMPPAMRELMRVLVEERNHKVMKDLRGELRRHKSDESISIFYGAGHMTDLERRLQRDLNYEPREEIWFAAISVDARKAGIGEMEIKMTREMAKRQLKLLQRTTPPQSPAH